MDIWTLHWLDAIVKQRRCQVCHLSVRPVRRHLGWKWSEGTCVALDCWSRTVRPSLGLDEFNVPPTQKQGRIWEGGGGGGVRRGGRVPGFRPPLPPKCTSVCFFGVFLVPFFSFLVCLPSILGYNNEQGKPRWIFKVKYCGELFFWSVLFPWPKTSETIWIPKYKKRSQNYRSNATFLRLLGDFAPQTPQQTPLHPTHQVSGRPLDPCLILDTPPLPDLVRPWTTNEIGKIIRS